MHRWLWVVVLGCAPAEDAEYCTWHALEEQCPASLTVENELGGAPTCIDGALADVIEVVGEPREGEEERVFDPKDQTWVLEYPCCYDVRVRPSDEDCSAE